MRRNSVLVACLLPLLCGCGVQKHPVFVDVDAVVRQDPKPTESLFKLPEPPAPTPGISFEIPAKPQRIVKDAGGQIKTSIAEIEKTQSDAIRTLNVRLRTLYDTEVAHFARDRFAEFEGVRTRAYEAANLAIQDQFQRYGEKRGPLIAALAVIVGWPDTNPTSKGDPTKMRADQRVLFERSKKLRTDISALDVEFGNRVDKILANAQGLSGQKLIDAQHSIDQFRTELNKKADAEAAKQVRATPKELDIRLAGARTTVLPPIPAQSVQIPGGSPLAPAPQVTFKGIENGPGDRRRMVEQELRIWLGLNRLTLAKRGRGIPDRTEEFISWRKTLLSDGP